MPYSFYKKKPKSPRQAQKTPRHFLGSLSTILLFVVLTASAIVITIGVGRYYLLTKINERLNGLSLALLQESRAVLNSKNNFGLQKVQSEPRFDIEGWKLIGSALHLQSVLIDIGPELQSEQLVVQLELRPWRDDFLHPSNLRIKQLTVDLSKWYQHSKINLIRPNLETKDLPLQTLWSIFNRVFVASPSNTSSNAGQQIRSSKQLLSSLINLIQKRSTKIKIDSLRFKTASNQAVLKLSDLTVGVETAFENNEAERLSLDNSATSSASQQSGILTAGTVTIHCSIKSVDYALNQPLKDLHFQLRFDPSGKWIGLYGSQRVGNRQSSSKLASFQPLKQQRSPFASEYRWKLSILPQATLESGPSHITWQRVDAKLTGPDLPTALLRPLLPTGLKNFQSAGSVRINLRTNGDQLQVKLQSSLYQSSMTWNLLAKDPLEFNGIKFSAMVNYLPRRNELNTPKFKIWFDQGKKTRHLLVGDQKSSSNPIEVTGTAFFKANRIWQNGSVSMRLAPSSCQGVLSSIPSAFAPQLQSFQMAGSVGGKFILTYDSLAKEPWKLTESFDHFTCRVHSAPYAYSAQQLQQSFRLRKLPKEDGQPVLIELDPTDPAFVQFSDISPYFIRALVAAEDANFHWHQGIDRSALGRALARNLAEGRVVLGGSTITMQTVKNLYLSPARTLSRKAQELVLSWHLENLLGKKRILEIYTNIAHFGPQIHGIGPAARDFFDKESRHLSLRESVYLATLLPAPIPRYRWRCSGNLALANEERVDSLIDRMYRLGKLSAFERQLGKSQRINFAPLNRENTNYCMKLARSSSLL